MSARLACAVFCSGRSVKMSVFTCPSKLVTGSPTLERKKAWQVKCWLSSGVSESRAIHPLRSTCQVAIISKSYRFCKEDRCTRLPEDFRL